MPTFGPAQMSALLATTLDYHIRGNAHAANIKNKPLLNDLWNNRKTFSGGVEFITFPYKEFAGGNFSGIDTGNDDLEFVDLNNDTRLAYPYFEHFTGLKMTRKQLRRNGIEIGTKNVKGAKKATQAEKVQLANLLESKYTDFSETWSAGFNALFWGDGSADPLGSYGIRTFIVDDPDAPLTVGQLSNTDYPTWKNFAESPTLSANLDEQELIAVLEELIQQLSLHASGRVMKHKGYLDSISAKRLRAEIRSKNGPNRDTIREVRDEGTQSSFIINGVRFEVDPSMDEFGLTRRIYIVDHASIFLMMQTGDEKRVHDPESPHNKLAFYKGVLSVGNLVADRRNTSAVVIWADEVPSGT